MPENAIIARPYATAVFSLAMAANDLPQWSEVLDVLAEISKNSQINKLLYNPRVTWQQRATLINECAVDALREAPQQINNFIKLLAVNNRLVVLPEIAAFYRELCAEKAQIIKAQIISAVILEKQQQEKLQQALSKRLQREIEMQYQQDEALIGGMIIRIGDHIIDSSIRGKLEKMRKNLCH